MTEHEKAQTGANDPIQDQEHPVDQVEPSGETGAEETAVEETATPIDPVTTLETEIERLKKENQELQTNFLRSRADLENFRKRTERDRQETIKFANKTIFMDILAVLDNFERAMTAIQDPKDPFAVGVGMIFKQVTDLLEQNGVEEILAVGRAFDPYLHEALTQEHAPEPEGTVIDAFQKGFRFKGHLLRPTKVKVSMGPEPDPETTSSETTEESAE